MLNEASVCVLRNNLRLILAMLALSTLTIPAAEAGELLAGVAKVDISEPTLPANDPLFAKALVLKQDDSVAVVITVDAVSIGGRRQ